MTSKAKRTPNVITGDGNIISGNSTSQVVKQATRTGVVIGTVHTSDEKIHAGESKIPDIVSSRRSESKSSLYEYKVKLEELGRYFIRSLPSEVSAAKIIETEAFLNDLYISLIDTDSRIKKQIESEILPISSSLSYSVKLSSNRRYEMDFFSNIKRLGRLLEKLSILL